MACRLIPNLLVFRPADAIETADAWLQALSQKKRPSMLLLSRQNLPVIDRSKYNASNVAQGGYIIKSEINKSKLDAIIISTGSEVAIAITAAENLEKQGYSIRVVSLVCWELFEEQSQEYKETILPSTCKKRLAVEAGITLGWERYTFDSKNVIGINSYGASAPSEILAEKFGFTAQNIENVLKTIL